MSEESANDIFGQIRWGWDKAGDEQWTFKKPMCMVCIVRKNRDEIEGNGRGPATRYKEQILDERNSSRKVEGIPVEGRPGTSSRNR